MCSNRFPPLYPRPVRPHDPSPDIRILFFFLRCFRRHQDLSHIILLLFFFKYWASQTFRYFIQFPHCISSPEFLPDDSTPSGSNSCARVSSALQCTSTHGSPLFPCSVFQPFWWFRQVKSLRLVWQEPLPGYSRNTRIDQFFHVRISSSSLRTVPVPSPDTGILLRSLLPSEVLKQLPSLSLSWIFSFTALFRWNGSN